MNVQDFLTRLDAVRETSHPTWRWQARCPAHDDTDPSLSVGMGDDGWTLLRCWTGCRGEDSAAALDVTVSDRFTRRQGGRVQ